MRREHRERTLNPGFNAANALLIVLVLGLFVFAYGVYGQPTGANVTFNTTEEPLPSAAASLTTEGGSFTKLVLNGSFQTQKWKAYVGNVTGIITLDDANSQTIYDWNLATIAGEVYVTRNGSMSWTGVSCGIQSTIDGEETFLNINASSDDSINSTFNETTHKEFWVGTTQIASSTCRSLITYVNDTKQGIDENAPFQEVLLRDENNNPVYVTMLEDETAGYDLGSYDFQMIVPEDETAGTPTTYYFYVEIS